MAYREVGYFISIITVIVALGIDRRSPLASHGAVTIPLSCRFSKLLVGSLITWALVCLAACFYFNFGGSSWGDESFLIHKYVPSLFTLQPVEHGAAKISFAAYLKLLFLIFPNNFLTVRVGMATLSALGLAIFWRWMINQKVDSRLVSLAVAISCISTQVIYFSQLAFEVSSMLFCIPLCVVLVDHFLRRDLSVFSSFGLGAGIGLACLTYAATPLFCVAIISAFLLMYANPFSGEGRRKFREISDRPWVIMITGFVLCIGTAYLLHLKIGKDASFGLGGGGGKEALSFDAYISQLLFALIELFLETRSYFQIFPDYPFFEPSLLGLAFGRFLSVGCSPEVMPASINLLIGASFIYFFLFLPLTGDRAGIRRALILQLIPYALFVAIGIQTFLCTNYKTSKARFLSLSLISLAFLTSALFQATVALQELKRETHIPLPDNSGTYDRYFPELRSYNPQFSHPWR